MINKKNQIKAKNQITKLSAGRLMFLLHTKAAVLKIFQNIWFNIS